MTQQFAVATDSGIDVYDNLNGRVPIAPFSVIFGEETFSALDLPRAELIRRVLEGGVQPSTSQPTPQAWAQAFTQAGAGGLPVLAVTISSGLSGSINAAEQARSLVDLPVELLDSRTLSAAQAFVVHAAATAAERGESLETARDWVQQVKQETELFFTIETLDYLKRGGRIGKVQAAVGGLLNIKPVITVEKPSGVYVNAAKARGYKGAIKEIAAQVTRRYGEGTPLRLGLLEGSHPEDADLLRAEIAARHPVVWEGRAPVNPALMVHTGPRAVGVSAAPGNWPWER